MMLNSNFQLWVMHVLVKDHYVNIPELGCFTLRELDSTVNIINREYKPRHSQLVFSTKSSSEDSSLAEFVMNQTGSSYKEAIQLIKGEVALIKSQLVQKKYYSFGTLGNFFYNQTSGIFFISRNQSNLHNGTFGLMPLKWELNSTSTETRKNTIPHVQNLPVNESETEVEEANVVEIDDAILGQTIDKRRGYKFWNIAASVALLSISFGAVYLMSLSWNHVLNNQQTASQIPVPKISHESPEFILVNGKVVSTKNSPKTNTDSTLNKPETLENERFTIEQYRSAVVNVKGRYFVVGGSYMTENAAKLECSHWEKLGYPSTYIKVKNSSLLKIILKRFEKEQDASDFAVSIKDQPSQSISVQNLQLQ